VSLARHGRTVRRIIETAYFKHRNTPKKEVLSNGKRRLEIETQRLSLYASSDILIKETLKLYDISSQDSPDVRFTQREYRISEDASELKYISTIDSHRTGYNHDTDSPYFRRLQQDLQRATKIFRLSDEDIQRAKNETKDAVVPILEDEAIRTTPDSVVREANRVILTTMSLLGEDLTPYRQGIQADALLDYDHTNELGQFTFRRIKTRDKDISNMIALILSWNKIIDLNGEEQVASSTPEGNLILSLSSLNQAFVKGEQAPIEVQAGIVLIEEAVHFIQRARWGMVSDGTAATSGQIELHNLKEIEAHAAWIRKALYKVIYPDIYLYIPGIDIPY